jgi:hypothetical protein
MQETSEGGGAQAGCLFVFDGIVVAASSPAYWK